MPADKLFSGGFRGFFGGGSSGGGSLSGGFCGGGTCGGGFCGGGTCGGGFCGGGAFGGGGCVVGSGVATLTLAPHAASEPSDNRNSPGLNQDLSNPRRREKR